MSRASAFGYIEMAPSLPSDRDAVHSHRRAASLNLNSIGDSSWRTGSNASGRGDGLLSQLNANRRFVLAVFGLAVMFAVLWQAPEGIKATGRGYLSSHLPDRLAGWREQRQTEAYIYLMTKDNRLKTLLASEMSHRAANSTRPRYVYAPDTLSQQTLDILEIFDLKVLPTPPFNPDDYPSLKTTAMQRWKETPLKFQLFNTTFDRLVALDVDMLIRHNVDDLFDKEKYPYDFYAARDDFMCNNGGDRQVNGGIQVLQYNPNITADLLQMLMDPSKHYRAADQQILSEYWTKNAEPDHHFILDSEYMAFLNRCTCGGNKFSDERNRIIHFSWFQSYTGDQFDRHWQEQKSPDLAELGTCHWKYRQEWRDRYFEAEDMVLHRDLALFEWLRNGPDKGGEI